MSFLADIVQTKMQELQKCRDEFPLSEMRSQALNCVQEPKYPFFETLKNSKDLTIIAEVKKHSPSEGLIAKDFQPVQKALDYYQSGANAISVLTDQTYFHGSLSFLKDIVKEVALPCLRKDFIIDEYQIYETKLSGASAMLLIVSILTKNQFESFHSLALDLGLDVLVEIHTEADWDKIKHISNHIRCLGINSRNLSDFSVDLNKVFLLKKRIKNAFKDSLWIAESGVNTLDDLKQIQQAGFDSALVGTALMRATQGESLLNQWIKYLTF